jgi:hypothetical protein
MIGDIKGMVNRWSTANMEVEESRNKPPFQIKEAERKGEILISKGTHKDWSLKGAMDRVNRLGLGEVAGDPPTPVFRPDE